MTPAETCIVVRYSACSICDFCGAEETSRKIRKRDLLFVLLIKKPPVPRRSNNHACSVLEYHVEAVVADGDHDAYVVT